MPTTTINLTGQALSKTDDTNVTLTLGGTPLTALLKATSLTLGWTGTLAATRGGTGLGALGTANQLLRVNGAGTALEYFTPSFGTGTVTSVSVVSANGFAGTVANATTTPAITISTSISGLLKGNGTAISAAVAGTDYLTPTGSGSGLSGVVTTVNGASGAITNIGVTTNPLSQFAATTSAQLAGVISDETGSGALVFGTSPTITTSLNLSYGTASTVVYLDASKNLISLANGNGVLTNNGSGTLTWAAASSGITIGTTTITSGGANRVLFETNPAGTVTDDAKFTYGGFFAGYLNVLSGYAINGVAALRFAGNGFLAGNNNAAGDYNVVIGNAGNSLAAGSLANTFLGYNAGYNIANGDFNVCLGLSTGGTDVNSTACIGSYTVCNTSNTIVFGAPNAASGNGVFNNAYFNGITSATPASIVINAAGGSGTNVAGASLTNSAGKATGTAASGNNVEQTSVKIASGTTLQSLTDRHNIVGKYVDITGGAATTFGNLALATSSTVAGGIIVYTVEANDGTDFQSLSGTAPYSVVNKAGALTYVLGTDVQSSACSAGTLTGTLSLTASGTTMSFQMNAVSSLVETVLRVSFQVLNNMGVATVSAA